jgi:phosphatidylglycerophosphate synthase
VSDYINPANAVTASRFLTLPPYIYFIDQGMYQWATLTVLVCGLLDLLDGKVAKWFDCCSGFGELFDAVADAICYGVCLLVLAIYGWVPWQPVAAIAVMGAINSVMRGIYARRAGRATNYRSFAMERIVAFSAYLIGIGINDFLIDYFYYTCVALMLIVVMHDSKRMLVDPVPSGPVPSGPVPSGSVPSGPGPSGLVPS